MNQRPRWTPKPTMPLLSGLRAKLRGRTGIVISHRFSNVRDADQIYVFDRGRVVEHGSHLDLMARGGLYAETNTSQAAAFIEPVAVEEIA